nr:hypothetical protein DBT45_11575 [Aerococcus tenax]
MPSPDGSIDYGFISAETAAVLKAIPGPIRVQVGWPGPNGWGARHVLENPSRMAGIADVGFPNLTDYVASVVRHHQWIGDAKNGRLALVYRHVHAHSAYDLELIILAKEENAERFWSMVTAIPKRVSRAPELYRHTVEGVIRTERSEPSLGDASNRPRRETLSLPKLASGSGKGS